MFDSEKVIGFIACGVAVLFFGSNYVALKKVYTGDGIFVQWCMTMGVLCVGFPLNLFLGCPRFYPQAMLGGFLWATGNALTPWIVNQIGMALGILLWSTSNLLMGWSSGRFGLFGLKPENNFTRETSLFNYLGVGFTLGSGILFLFVKNGPPSADTPRGESANDLVFDRGNGGVGGANLPTSSSIMESTDDENVQTIAAENNANSSQPSDPSQTTPSPFKRFIAMGLALVCGLFFGVTFDPVIYVIDNDPDSLRDQLPYGFSMFCGIFAGGTIWFLVYCVVTRGRPEVPPSALIPGLVAGAGWAIAQCAYLVANQTLSEADSFPIISRTPGIVAAMWGVFYFREIRGKRNLLMLGFAISVLLIGKVFATLGVVLQPTNPN